ncbi:hypothetical protein OEA41_001952 [Lepraria neglecta]|uniref:Glucose receptor Git3-like N-terminal domain-containing protein n=1 Tax=Lepraria neglecta TaxID=209136 RepID=A0AAE0DLY7_9LECA|nr:hypothetical protein OEA41_001952 [Lepraria neglecta]
MPSQAFGSPISTSIKVNNYTKHEKHIQQILAATFASTSILAGLVAFYWFARMKRNFRHHLIMLLIASDMFKAIWYFVPAILTLAHGHPISNGFCQGGGFLLATGLEASDFIILLIAIHTALSVLCPRKITQESGLFPFRYQAYACWAVFSILLPGLAFANAHNNGYISQGTFCYLPVRPIWYRLALSWVPRYAILIIILAIYISIYIYTKSKFGDFDIDFSSSSVTSADRSQSKTSENGFRPQAPATDKGLQPTAPRSQASPAEDTSKKKGKVPKRPSLTHRPSWLKYSFSRSAPMAVVNIRWAITPACI